LGAISRCCENAAVSTTRSANSSGFPDEAQTVEHSGKARKVFFDLLGKTIVNRGVAI